jgi:hypothetical protein
MAAVTEPGGGLHGRFGEHDKKSKGKSGFEHGA